MKKILAIAFVSAAMAAAGQVVLYDSVSRMQVTVYAGTLGGPAVSVSDAKSTGFYTSRIGGTLTWSPARRISVYGLGAGQLDHAGTVVPFALCGVSYSPHKRLRIMAGRVAAPMTELRPVPTTGFGQFEPWTRAQIPGPAVGGKMTLMRDRYSVVVGTFKRGDEYSVEGGLKFSRVHFATYYLPESKAYGGAVNLDLKNFWTTIMCNGGQRVGMLNVITFPRLEGIACYQDIGFDAATGAMLRGEWGLFKTFSVSPIRGLLGFGYGGDAIKSYIFLYL